METKEILENITSKETHKVWQASCEIISNGQNHDKIKPLIVYLPLIKEKTRGLNLGGAFAPNQRFIDFAIKTIEFHKTNEDCYCNLYNAKFRLTNGDIFGELQYDGFNPNKEVEKGHIEIINVIRIEDKWIDFYAAKCSNCKTVFNVEEREGHYMFWNWKKVI